MGIDQLRAGGWKLIQLWLGFVHCDVASVLVSHSSVASATHVSDPIEECSTSVAVLIIYIVQAGLGFLIVGVSDSSATDVLHSSIGSLTWVALATLLWLTRTLATSQRTNPSQS